MTIQSGLLSQKIDTTGKVWIPRTDAIRKLREASMYKSCLEFSELLKKDTAILGARVRSLSSANEVLQQTSLSYKRELALKEAVVQTMEAKLTASNQQVTLLNKDVRRYKRKVRRTAFFGILTTVGVAILPKLLKL